MLADVQALDTLVASLEQGAERELRIVVDVLLPNQALVAFAREFRATHPEVELVLFSDVLSAVSAHVRERAEMLRQYDANHASVCTSTESTAGRSRTIGFQLSPASAETYTWPPVVPK